MRPWIFAATGAAAMAGILALPLAMVIGAKAASASRRASAGVSIQAPGSALDHLSGSPGADSKKAPRFPQLTLEQLNEEQRPLAEDILKVSSVGIGGPYNLMLRSPEMGKRMFQLVDYLRFHTSVPRRLNEFAILIQARLWTAQVEWYSHYPQAIKAGLSESVAADLKQGKRPAAMQPDEAVVYDFCMELSTQRQVSDATFQRARAIFSDQQIVDLIAVTGNYVTAAMLLNAGEQGAPGGQTPLQPLSGR